METQKRESLGSRLGFILISAGCAIGLGNVWRFPWLVGQNGGAVFVFVYLFFLLVLGIPVMTMEFTMGRGAQKSPLHMYKALAPEKKAWNLHSPVFLVANFLLMMFYTTVCGWMFIYFSKFATGQLSGLDQAGVGAAFGALLGDPTLLCLTMGLVVVLGFFILSMGLRNGLERVTKIMMLLLLGMMVLLAINSCFLEGGAEGIKFYLKPNMKAFMEAEGGAWRVCVNAMNQAFFTLSLGIGSMAIFGSYLSKDRSLFGESLHVSLLDTFVAIVAGLIIFPACFAYNNGATNAGPGLLFVTLPNVFNAMPNGRLWGALFFVFMSFAAFSTVLAVFENILAMVMDKTGWARPKACAVCSGLMFVLSLPCALSFNLLSGFEPLGPGSGVLDLEDFLVSNLALPAGSLLFALFCTHRFGWGWDRFVAEANTGRGLKIPTSGAGKTILHIYLGYVLPLIIGFVLVMGLIDKYNEIDLKLHPEKAKVQKVEEAPADPAIEAPAAETPVAEVPAAEAPAGEAPAVPAADAPAADAPVAAPVEE